MDPNAIYTELRDMREEATTRHVEVVQRLTALEVSSAPIAQLEIRVKKLEGWKNFIVGIAVTVGFLLKTAVGYLAGKH